MEPPRSALPSNPCDWNLSLSEPQLHGAGAVGGPPGQEVPVGCRWGDGQEDLGAESALRSSDISECLF